MNDFLILPKFSLRPSQFSLYNEFVRKSGSSNTWENPIENKRKRLDNLRTSDKDIVKYFPELAKKAGEINRFHNWQISPSGRKTLQHKINWLYFLSKSRYKKSVSGKFINNFKLNFLTLTLPSTQVHNTAAITKECLNQFLVEMKQRFGMENFVWRLEFQKNGNVHYHLVTDTFCDFFLVRKIWNRILSKLGYVQAYTKKHVFLKLSEYCEMYSNGGQIDFDTLKDRYIKGKRNNWKVPNTVDVKSVSSAKKIAFYISKYFGKKNENQNPCNELDNEENSKGLRLWFCSRSLSKLDKISDYCEAQSIDLFSIISKATDKFKAVTEYCTTIYYSFKSLLLDGKQIIGQLLREYAYSLNYKPAI